MGNVAAGLTSIHRDRPSTPGCYLSSVDTCTIHALPMMRMPSSSRSALGQPVNDVESPSCRSSLYFLSQTSSKTGYIHSDNREPQRDSALSRPAQRHCYEDLLGHLLGLVESPLGSPVSSKSIATGKCSFSFESF